MVGANHLRIEIHGAVQGVGFRPFVYRLATELGLTGWVINDSRGVFIEVEGEQADLQAFLDRLPAEKPAISIINSLDAAWLEPTGFSDFEIRHSDDQGGKSVLILPDIATCPDCLGEVLDSADRRHNYPFTNCTNCGPRFSIIQALPYDRPNTTMHHFVMCRDCQAEYDSPRDRRFHAQPNACPFCGPEVRGQRSEVRGQLSVNGERSPDTQHVIRNTQYALRSGQIVAVKGLGGFHLMCDARNADAIQLLRDRKPRPTKPLALMARDLAQARTLVEIEPEAEQALTSPESPIVLLRRKVDAPVADNIAPGNPTLGVMLPYTPLHHLLLREVDFPIVATSGNLTDEPISINGEEAIERLGHIADLFLLHDRPIERHVDDSIAWMLDGETRLLRRARGFAPLPVSLPDSIPTILAVGAHLKNTVALSVGDQVFISQHIGDLETAEAVHAFERVIADFLRLYEATPAAIAHDLHPDYLSTKWAQAEVRGQRSEVRSQKSGIRPPTSDFRPLIPVQHHHAHLASVLAENHITGPALGVIWDGTGYGTDGTIWGGEFLLGDAGGYQRLAHLRPFRLPGGDSAVKEPRRVALALLWEMFGETALDRDDLAPISALSSSERSLLGQMLAKGVNSPVTTSMGRLFDGVAALLDLYQTVSFEAEAAIALEYVADGGVRDAYPLPIEGIEIKDQRLKIKESQASEPLIFNHQSLVLDWHPLISAILVDLDQHIPIPTIAARFHNSLVDAILAVAQHVGEPRIALSGGVFQNRLLVERTAQCLRENGFEVILHRQVPPNDGGISLGQIAIAARQYDQRSS